MKRRHFFLIQLLLWIAILLVSNHSWAATPQTAKKQAVQTTQAAQMSQEQQLKAVQVLEDTLFATNYNQEPITSRLDRLETITFGQANSNQPVAYRIRYLQDTIAQNTVKPLNQKPAESQQANNQPNYAPSLNLPPQQQAYQQAPAPDGTDYPTVTSMEQKVWNRTFVGEPLDNRLTRLEMQVFKIKQKGALSDRMDNLKLVVLGDAGPTTVASADPYGNDPYAGPSAPNYFPAQPSYQQPQTAYQQPQYQQIPPQSGYPAAPNYGQQQPNPYGQYAQPNPYANTGGGGAVTPDMLQAMNEVEKNVIGHTYANEAFDTRLNRVETKVFGQPSPEMSNDDRMQRVIAVASAGGAPQSPQAKAKSTMMNLLPIILTILPMLLL